eukprot:161518_1
MATGYTEKIKSTQREMLLNALNTQQFADITFIIGEEKTEYNVNRIFLSLISPVFNAMLYGKMKESEPNSNVHIKDMKPEIFESIISFAYCNDPKITDKNVLLLLQACDKYQIEKLSEICNQHFRSYLSEQKFCTYFHNAVRLRIFKAEICKIMLKYLSENYGTCLSSHNFCEFFSRVVELNLSDFILICEKYVRQSNSSVIQKIFKSDGFVKMELKTMRFILKADPLKSSEEGLWDALLKWAEYQSTKHVEKVDDKMKHEEEDVKYDDRKIDNDVKAKEYKLYLLKSVKDLMRFGLMDGTYFARFVEPEKIFNNKELVTILLYYQQPERGCGAFETRLRITPNSEKFCANPIKYKLKTTAVNKHFSNCSGYGDLIDEDLNKRLCIETATKENNVWIEAQFDTLTTIVKMQMGSTEWPKEINGKTVQLKDAHGNWFTVMKLSDFKAKESKAFYMIGRGIAIRIVSYSGCISIGHWKLFSCCK